MSVVSLSSSQASLRIVRVKGVYSIIASPLNDSSRYSSRVALEGLETEFPITISKWKRHPPVCRLTEREYSEEIILYHDRFDRSEMTRSSAVTTYFTQDNLGAMYGTFRLVWAGLASRDARFAPGFGSNKLHLPDPVRESGGSRTRLDHICLVFAGFKLLQSPMSKTLTSPSTVESNIFLFDISIHKSKMLCNHIKSQLRTGCIHGT
jgi:hypothetical protein